MAAQIESHDQYADKLAKLLPAEGIAALLAIKNLIPDEQSLDKLIWLAVVAVGIFILLWEWKVRRVTAVIQLAFLVGAYLVWAANVFTNRLDSYFNDSSVVTLAPPVLAILVTLFTPLLFPTPSK